MSARQTALGALIALLLLAVVGAGFTATAATPPGAAARAGAFLERELAAGGHVLDYPGTDQPDYGVTIDAVLALAASGTGPDEAAAATRQVRTHLDDYLGPAFGATELYAGPLAKTALLAMTMGEDPRAFAERDLLGDLAALQTSDGRYADRTAYTDSSNTFTQGLALTALVRAGERPPPVGVGFLLDQQCDDGGFKLFVESAGCSSDPDATAMAVIALLAVDDPTAAEGLDFLAGRLDASGGIGGGVGAESPNTNSTGLAATAFAAGGRAEERARAGAFLTSMQLGCSAPVAARGAIAYDADAYAALVAAGADAQVSDQERRATSQAAFGLSGAALLSVSIAGAAPGSDGCTSGPSTSPPSTSPPSTSPSPPDPRSGTATTTVTATVTVTGPAPAPPPAVTVTVTQSARAQSTVAPSASGAEGLATDVRPTRAGDETGSEGGASATLAEPAPSAPPAAAPSASAAPAAAAGESPGRLPYLVASGLVLLGAASAAYILIRGRN